ncbi:MAG: SAM-dependent methyltransferase [Gammaproteobacteria bacterium]|jgi:SAM-dependent methyltransferase
MNSSRKFPLISPRELADRLRSWFSDGPGVSIRDAELDIVATILPNLFGYHLVQLGSQVSGKFIETTRIAHVVALDAQAVEGQAVALVANCEALPLAAASIDVLLAPHILEFSPQPHAVLREAERVLIGEGYIVITGFNPWSFCGAWRLLGRWRGAPPWNGQFLSAARLKDWLELLGFEIEFLKKTSFRPPIARRSIIGKLTFLEVVGRACWPWFGNVYVVVAKKRVAAVTPLKLSWQTRRQVIAKGVAEPSTRSGNASLVESNGPEYGFKI